MMSKYPPTVFRRYDLSEQKQEGHVRRVSEDTLLQQVADGVVGGDEDELRVLVDSVLETREPMEVINQGLIAGMNEVSRLWSAGAFFLPQVILSSDAMMVGIELCETKMGSALEKRRKW